MCGRNKFLKLNFLRVVQIVENISRTITQDNSNLQINDENKFLESLKNQDYFSFKEITVEDVSFLKNLALDEFSSDDGLLDSIAPEEVNSPTQLIEFEDLSLTVDEDISFSILNQPLSTYDSVFSKNLNQDVYSNKLSTNNDLTYHNATPSCCGCSSCLGLANNNSNNGSANQGSSPQAAQSYTTGIEALIGAHKWSNTTITYSFLTRVPDYYPGNAEERYQFTPFNETQKAAARRALQLYSEISGLNFVEVSDEGEGGTIRFGTANMQHGGAHAYFPHSDLRGGDVWLNNRFSANLTQTDGSYGFHTMVHEIGHALGLKHPGNYNAGGGGANGPYLDPELDNNQYTIMSYNDHQGSLVYNETPMLYDIAAIQSLYGANYDTRAGDTTYGWNADRAFVETIWDGGGTDTIDASNQVFSSVINLNEGNFSSIGHNGDFASRAVNNLAIAYGVTIENAVGGSGNDFLIGNNVSNILVGGSGNDTLAGGSGYDVLVGETGNDTFVLGTSAGVFYQGDEYARITDFNPLYDYIQVKGTANQYSLETANWFGSDALDTAIFWGDDAIAVIQDTTDVNFNRDFIFV